MPEEPSAGDHGTGDDAGLGADGDDGDGDAYVHRPSGEPPRKAAATDDEFGRRGWLLVGVLLFAFLVVPWTLILLPTAQSSVGALGLSWRDTYFALPMVPAVLLGLVGVWTALAARRE